MTANTKINTHWTSATTLTNWVTAGTTSADAYIFKDSPVSAHIASSGKLSLHGEKADIEINGKSLTEMLERIEERMNLLTVNPELENDWDELRQLGDQYRALEKHIKEKMETWKRIKARDKDNL